MKKMLKVLVVMIMLIAVSCSFVSAEKDNVMIVLGAEDFYPIEYYDAKNDQYCGVVPDILKSITEKTGIVFKYIYVPEGKYDDIIEKTQADIVSGYVIGSKENYVTDRVKIFAYDHIDQTVNIGLAFTAYADADNIAKIKTQIEEITENEINGYLVGTVRKEKPEKSPMVLLEILVGLLLVVSLVFLGLKQKKTSILMKKSKYTDNETGIGNLAFFEHSFTEIPAAERSKYYIAYIVIDTNFLLLNRENAIVDNLNKYAAHVIDSAAGEDGFAARITESEYALVFCKNDDAGAKEHIKKLIATLKLSTKQENEIVAEDSVKAVLYNLHPDDYSSEILLYNLRRKSVASSESDGGVVLCNVDDMNSEIEEKKLIADFNDGFHNREFRLYLQFIVDNKTKKIVSAEALSRWEHSERGQLLPGAYIKSMESVGAIKELDFYMFEMVCRQLHKWHGTDMGNISISCNFTRRTLSEESFADRIEEITRRYIFDKSSLIIEITENTMEKNTPLALENVRKCKELGFRVALDDLGSGYTSLANLCDYPIDVVKIDRNILLKTQEEHGKELFSGMVAFAHNLNKKVVCEGVETEEQNTFVTASDCDYIQGWYYGKAVPVESCEEFFKEYTNKE